MAWCYDSFRRYPCQPRSQPHLVWVESVKHSVKCDSQGCHRRKRVSVEELSLLREESRRSGRRAGLICPACVKRAFDNPEEYDLDITLGELVVEAARETPRWRLCFGPEMT